MEAVNLSYIYNSNYDKKTVDGVNLKIEKGRYVSLIGETGSGKTTLAENLGLILKPTEGKVLFDGVDVWASKAAELEFRKKIGVVFQFAHHQLFAETVYDDIAFGPRNLGFSEQEVGFKVHNAAALFGVHENLFKKSPFELSGGQQKRVAIAGVLAMEPSVLILDEPTAGIDPAGRSQILKTIRKYHDQTNCTTIHVTHNMQEVVDFADEVAVMNAGKVFRFGTVEEVFGNSDFLNEIGLENLQILEVFSRLKNLGFSVPTNVYDAKTAAEIIKKMILGEEKK